MNITQFTIEEVRCFAERQQFEIRPLTFLVGENSTGKTTALACFQALANYLGENRLDFNVSPYSMGTFAEIVRRRNRPDKSFVLGITFANDDERVECSVECVEKVGGFEPVVRSISLRFAEGEIAFRTDDTIQESMDLVWADEERNQYLIGVEPGYFEWYVPGFGPISQLFDGTDYFDRHRESKEDSENSVRDFAHSKYRSFLLGRDQNFGIVEGIRFVSTSPIRSQPKRTYDLAVEYNDPEGNDVPMRLMRIKATEKEDWETLKLELNEFGKRSGLFQSIDLKKLGRSKGAPFQLVVKVRGPSSNIMDVGYGISQVMPILVHVLNTSISHESDVLSNPLAYFLLQQPEVHLHPRAQAELSTLLAQLANRGNQSFIVETHSDYMIDRARIEIRRGNINKDDVSLIYFEPKKNVVKVHNITFDEMGNMLGVPPHFRDFFLLETDRLMGFEE